MDDPQSFLVKLSVNGVIKQNGNTGQMVFPVAAIIAFLSQFLTLEPGDIISTGTPSGVGSATGTYLKPGDIVDCVDRRDRDARKPRGIRGLNRFRRVGTAHRLQAFLQNGDQDGGRFPSYSCCHDRFVRKEFGITLRGEVDFIRLGRILKNTRIDKVQETLASR